MSEVSKLGISMLLTVARCGNGYHLRIPKKVVDAFKLEAGDEIHVDLNYLRKRGA